MQPSLRAFLNGILDYAGLFPPAKLDLDPAIRNYAEYRGQAENWMLGRFIIPVGRLGDLAPYRELFATGDSPFGFSVIGRGGATPGEQVEGMSADLNAIAEFRKAHADHVEVDVMEIRLGDAGAAGGAFGDVAALRDMFGGIADRVDADGPPRLAPFFEVPVVGNDRWREQARATAAAIAAHNATKPDRPRCAPIGLKLRCGGLEPRAFPTPEQVAAVIDIARQEGVQLKLTAGLHHPLRHDNASVNCKMHGFLNVFGAAILMHAGQLTADTAVEMLADESAGSFTFDAGGFAWRDHRADTAAVTAARTAFVPGYGSCSFDEPCEDLRELGLMP